MRPINPEDRSGLSVEYIALSTNGEQVAIHTYQGTMVMGRIFITKEELRALSNYIDQ